ncbi:hypothetical protein V1512DRAFT_287872 [Lipomyces arxii]|uniref:uncharacterized protein n=1 Tax=Lipomyces arxii TaxID=56418 RepID=UPI0034CD976E
MGDASVDPDDDVRDKPRMMQRRASINVSSLSSAHPPEFPHHVAPTPLSYKAHTADDLIVNQHLYYNPRADVRIPVTHRAKGEKSKSSHQRSGSHERSLERAATHNATKLADINDSVLFSQTLQPPPEYKSNGTPSPSQSTRSSTSSTIPDPDYNRAKDIKYNLNISAEWSHLLAIMKKLKGVVRAWARWKTESAYGSGFCYIEEFSGALLFERKDSTIVLMTDLRGCKVALVPTSNTAIRVTSSKDSNTYVILDPENPKDFTKWLAVLVSWSPLRAAGISSKLLRFPYPRLDFPVPNSKAKTSDDVMTSIRTIKVGQLQIWDPLLKRNSRKAKSSVSTHYWLPASCLLKTNGELQIFPDAQALAESSFTGSSAPDFYRNVRASISGSNVSPSSPLSSPTVSHANASELVFQLSTIRKSAIQKADKSLTGKDNCIVIFLKSPMTPISSQLQSQTQTTSSSSTSHQPSHGLHHHQGYGHHQPPTANTSSSSVLVFPIYLHFDSRTNFEVWFTLLRSLSLPELYGPDTGNIVGSFRQHRVLSMRIIDAKVLWPRGPAMHVESTVQTKSVDSYVDIELNDKVRARTRVKYNTSKPFWREDFQFPDLPFLVNSMKLSLKQRNRKTRDLSGDLAIGEVRLLISDIQQDSDLERWIPIYNPARGYMGKTGEVCVKLQMSEITVLASSEYDGLLRLLLDFSNRLTVELAEVTGDSKTLASSLLDIYQATGQATDWLIALAEDEIGEQQAVPATRTSTLQSFPASSDAASLVSSSQLISNRQSRPPLAPSAGSGSGSMFESGSSAVPDSSPNSTLSSRWPTRSNSSDERSEVVSSDGSTLSPGTLSPGSLQNASVDNLPFSGSSSPKLPPVNVNTVADANLLFRGNSLLTKSLDAHMRRIGCDYVNETLSPVIKKVVSDNALCEVDPMRLDNPDLIVEHWAKLNMYLNAIWDRIKKSAKNCPPSLRRIFHNIRLQIENRFGEFLMAASYSGVSGFIFLRFFCPAVLNPKLFGILQDHPPATAQRTLILIAKGLQGLANRTHFGYKESWMEPMNEFLNQHVHEVKDFIVEVSTWRTQIYTHDGKESNVRNDLQDDNEVEANKRSLLMVPYQIPNTILPRLPVAFRDSSPSLPYLIDRPAALAELVNSWLSWYDKKIETRRQEKAALDSRNGKDLDQSQDDSDDNDDDASRNDRPSSMASSSIEGMPDSYTDDSDDRYSSDEDREENDVPELEDFKDIIGDDDVQPTPIRTRIQKQEDMPTGLKFSSALLEFHLECLRIRETIQRLRYKSSVPDIPSEVPEETWDYYVANFLDTSQFHFVHRGKFLKSLFVDSTGKPPDDPSFKSEESEDLQNLVHGDDDFSYFPYTEEQQSILLEQRSSVMDLPSQVKKDYSLDTARSALSLQGDYVIKDTNSAESGSSTDSIAGALSSSMSRGFGSISKKSRSIRLPPWRKLLGSSSSSSSKK